VINYLLMSELIFKKIFYNTPEYLEALSIRREVFIKEQNVPENIEIDEYECNSHHFLLTKDSVPVACGRMRLKTPYIKFERIAGLKSHRGMGLGRVLMERMQEFARLNYPELTPYMHSQMEAVPFYEKLGWIKQGEIFFEAGIPHLVMTLT
jgi:predicted GNAT family N-acyltransferase